MAGPEDGDKELNSDIDLKFELEIFDLDMILELLDQSFYCFSQFLSYQSFFVVS